jgi:glucokinase
VGVGDARLLGKIAQIAIIVFVVLIAIDQLDLGGALVQQTFLILLAGVVLALALAFGLGGREWARLGALVSARCSRSTARTPERWFPREPPRLACFGVAGPVLGEQVKVTHLPWEIDAPALAARFGFARVGLLNDFAAAAHGIDLLAAADLATLQAGEPLPLRPKVVIGAGTGLGVAYVLGDAVLSGEGGHAAFAPADAQQAALWQWLHRRFGRVQVEHVVSGPGLASIYEFLLQQPDRAGTGSGEPLAAADPPQAIGQRALDGDDPLALAAVDLFIACYGALAGDHALNALARAGVYVTGGIAPGLLARLRHGGFLSAFNDKGVYAPITRACPVHVVLDPDLPLLGAARYAARTLTVV